MGPAVGGCVEVPDIADCTSLSPFGAPPAFKDGAGGRARPTRGQVLVVVVVDTGGRHLGGKGTHTR